MGFFSKITSPIRHFFGGSHKSKVSTTVRPATNIKMPMDIDLNIPLHVPVEVPINFDTEALSKAILQSEHEQAVAGIYQANVLYSAVHKIGLSVILLLLFWYMTKQR